MKKQREKKLFLIWCRSSLTENKNEIICTSESFIEHSNSDRRNMVMFLLPGQHHRVVVLSSSSNELLFNSFASSSRVTLIYWTCFNCQTRCMRILVLITINKSKYFVKNNTISLNNCLSARRSYQYIHFTREGNDMNFRIRLLTQFAEWSK